MTNAETRPVKYNWFAPGDINGFFGLMFDNVTVLSFMAFILTVLFKFPADIVYTKMFPGTAFGVLFGDAIYTWMAFRLAKRANNPNVTAMPLGLDTPSTIGITFAVLGPTFVAMKSSGMDERSAAMMTWYVGMATMVIIGVVKLIFSFIGQWVQRVVPQAGLLGSLAGIGLALIGFIPMVEVFSMPIIGLLALGLILYSLVAHIKLPHNFPGALAAVAIGTGVYYILGPMGYCGGAYAAPNIELHFGFPLPTLDFLKGMKEAMKFVPVALPFAILTVVGGINVTESARVAGDDYNTRNILLTEAVATIIAGIFGGVAQSTPYIGQPAYKHMGSRAGYTLLTGLFVGLGGIFGYISYIVEFIPRAVIAPILVFVALDIMGQAFIACPARHAAAVAFAYFPTVARMLQIKLTSFLTPEQVTGLMNNVTDKSLPELLITVALGNGFILTAMLWGAAIAHIIDRRLKAAAVYIWICAGFTFFGIIHSAIPDGNMYLPWTLSYPANQIPFQFTAGYLLLGLLLFSLSYTKESKMPIPEHMA